MGEVILSTGSITIDISGLTVNEWRGLFSGKNTAKQDDAIIEKVTGIAAVKVGDLLRDDWRRIINAIVKEGNQPLADPNSQSVST